jgi:hypothetical protein
VAEQSGFELAVLILQQPDDSWLFGSVTNRQFEFIPPIKVNSNGQYRFWNTSQEVPKADREFESTSLHHPVLPI